ncbi:unnamed protein product [Rodentolepis nana]|uniref:DNA helicase n=2 Tax=Hymenolepididae TaxID=6214 RepID=A0A0R3TMM5_RODNA|nr:unnamed protein product [Rodentolepis nana]
MAYNQEFLSQIKDQIKNKLIELDAFGDEELPDYITVMVANKKKRSSMKKDLQLFLGDDTDHFTEWLHDLLSSKSQDVVKKDKSRKSSSSDTSGVKLSRSPLRSRKPPLDVQLEEDVLNFQTEENEFRDELAAESKPEFELKEQRRVVATSSLKDNGSRRSSDETPVVRSVVKVSNKKSSSIKSFDSSVKPNLPIVGGKLLKQAMEDVKNNAIQSKERLASKRKIKMSPDIKEIVTPSQTTSSLDSDESEVPKKMTKFVVTMNDEALVGLKPSVKSRLGPRVVTHGNLDTSAEILDARSILLARKMVNEESEDISGKFVDESVPDAKKADRNSVPSTLQRCKYWPNCRNQDNCEFFHPKEDCKSFPNCRYGTRCLYIHPPCRYGSQCSRLDCAFTHPSKQTDTVSTPPTPKIICRYYPHCKMPPGTCPYFHPSSMPLCRFGPSCLNRATCPFVHTTPINIPTANKLKWVAPGKSSGNRNSTDLSGVSGASTSTNESTGSGNKNSSNDDELDSVNSNTPSNSDNILKGIVAARIKALYAQKMNSSYKSVNFKEELEAARAMPRDSIDAIQGSNYERPDFRSDIALRNMPAYREEKDDKEVPLKRSSKTSVHVSKSCGAQVNEMNVNTTTVSSSTEHFDIDTDGRYDFIGICVFKFEKALDDEITIRPGDRLTNICKFDDEWLWGTTKQGKSGRFPKSYVELYEDESNTNKRNNYWRYRGRGGFCRSSNTSHSTINHSFVAENLPVSQKGPTVLVKKPKFSQLPGWLHYFPATVYEPDSNAVKYTKAFIDYIKGECCCEGSESHTSPSFINWAALEENPVMNVDFSSLKNSPTLAKKLDAWLPESNSENKFDSKLMILSLGLAVHTVATEKLYGINTNPLDQNGEVKLPYIAARLVDHFPPTPLRSLRAHHLGDLISIRATVARLGPIRPLCCRLCFRCGLCETEQVLVIEDDGCFATPTKCPEKGCRSRIFHPIYSSPSTLVIDTRTLLIQESDEDDSNQDQQSTTGRVPRSITCFVDRDLVESCVPGDFVHVCGVVSLLSSSVDASVGSGLFSKDNRRPLGSTYEVAAGGKGGNVFNLCLRVNNLTRIFNRAGEDGDCNKVGIQCLTTRRQDSHVNERITEVNVSELNEVQSGDTHFSLNDLYAIRGIAEESNLFNLLIASFCPSICGRELVKMAILLATFGASTNSWSLLNPNSHKVREKSPDLSISSEEEEQENEAMMTSNEEISVRRCSSHVLFVGDPGIGKSQLLRAAASISPRAIYVCGNTTSAAGLTVSACRDSSSFGLEAGALVLADQGICCIDEFDKISCDPATLLEVLEQQTVSVARGGYVCNLAARTSVLAAANPVVGQYDPSKTVYENVRINRSLISRFDLIFILPDRPSENLDRRLSEHVLALHMGRQIKRESFETSTSFSSTLKDEGDPSSLPLESRLRVGNSNQKLVPGHLLRKYIAYAKAYVHPKMTPEAAQFIHQFYLNLRKRRKEQRDLFQVTIRQLESLIRLSSARARAELREEITKEDAQDVCDLMMETGYGTSLSFSSPSAPPIKKRKNASSTGVSATKRLLAALQREAGKSGGSRNFTTQEIAGIAAQIGLSGDDSILYQRCTPGGTLSILIDNLNHIGALLKRGSDLYSLT